MDSAAAFKKAGLRQRVITSLVISSLLVAVVIFAPLLWFQWLMALLFLLAAWEWSGLSACHHPLARSVYLLCIAAGFYMLDHIVFSAGSDTSISMLGQMMLLALLFWLGVLWCVLSYPGSAGFWGGRLFRLIMGVCVLLPAWSGLVFLKQQHEDGLLVLWLVGIVAMADMGAYFVGVRFGQHKLAPQVSPGKSWEGVAGGVLANLLFAVMLSLYLNTSFREGLWMGLTMIAVGLASILGDLFESMLKRYGGIKDSGTLLPGHGGVLDRIDGWMAAVPVFVFVYLYGIGLY